MSLLVIDLDDLAVAHLAAALGRYLRLMPPGMPMPSELLALAEQCVKIGNRARTGQDGPKGQSVVDLLDRLAEGGHVTPLLHSLSETGRILGGVSESSVKRLIRTGALSSVVIGGRRMVRQADIESYVARLGGGSFRDDIATKIPAGDGFHRPATRGGNRARVGAEAGPVRVRPPAGPASTPKGAA